eukprot:443183_1
MGNVIMGNEVKPESLPAIFDICRTRVMNAENVSDDEIVQSPVLKFKERERLATYGFLRRQQYVQYKMPPDDIIYTICIFLQLMDEWNDSMTHIHIQINRNTIVKDHKGVGYCHAFGKDTIAFGQYKFWDFQIITPERMGQAPDYPDIILGIIDENDIEPCLPDFTSYGSYGIGLSLRENKLFHNGESTTFNQWYMNSVYVTNGDFIRMELDLRNGKYGVLRYIVGMDISTKMTFEKIDINRKYKLCVALMDGKHGLKLVNGI